MLKDIPVGVAAVSRRTVPAVRHEGRQIGRVDGWEEIGIGEDWDFQVKKSVGDTGEWNLRR